MGGIAILIVTYNSAAEIGPCLDAALATGAEVVVVDNASSDATPDAVLARGARLIRNARNAGFAAAVNQAVRATKAPLLLLLNPDAVIERGIECLAAACTSVGAGFAGGKLVDGSGAPQKGFCIRKLPSVLALSFEALLVNRLWPRNPVNWQYRCLGMDYSVPCEAEQPAGAFLMIAGKSRLSVQSRWSCFSRQSAANKTSQVFKPSLYSAGVGKQGIPCY